MKLPSVDSPFMEKANDISDLLIVNILYFIVCIPIVTIGAATSALYYTSFCYQDKKPHGGMTFLRAFKENFKILETILNMRLKEAMVYDPYKKIFLDRNIPLKSFGFKGFVLLYLFNRQI